MEKQKGRVTIARIVGDRIEELRGVRSQKDISDIVGYNNQNMITMIKQGNAKLALDRVSDMAKALEVDPVYLMRLALEQFYDPKVVKEMIELFGGYGTGEELELLQIVRKRFGLNFKLTDYFERSFSDLLKTIDPKTNEKL